MSSQSRVYFHNHTRGFKQHEILKYRKRWFSRQGDTTNKFSFDQIIVVRDESSRPSPSRPGLVMKLFDDLFAEQMKINETENSKENGFRV